MYIYIYIYIHIHIYTHTILRFFSCSFTPHVIPIHSRAERSVRFLLLNAFLDETSIICVCGPAFLSTHSHLRFYSQSHGRVGGSDAFHSSVVGSLSV